MLPVRASEATVLRVSDLTSLNGQSTVTAAAWFLIVAFGSAVSALEGIERTSP